MLKKNNINPLISVIIPAYNEEKYISRCIESVTKQKYKNIETIVINDGSTDNTLKVATGYRVKVFNLSHGGPGQARNYGAKKAKGEILVFLDADLFIDEKYIDAIIFPLVKGKCDAVFTTKEFVGNIKNIWSKCWNINSELPIGERIKKNTKEYGQAFRAIIKKKFMENKGFIPSWGYIDDRSLARSKIKICSVNNAICYHFNPETLEEVYYSARWIGRSKEFGGYFYNLLRYSIVNSMKVSINKVQNGAPLLFILFKIIFDLGIITGIIFKNSKHNYSK